MDVDWDCTGITFANERPPILHIGDQPNADLWPSFLRLLKALDGYAPEFVVCFLPYKGAPQYRSIKKIADVDRGFATQCLVIEKAIGMQQAYYANVALKINVKLAGINALSTNPLPGLTNDTIILCVCPRVLVIKSSLWFVSGADVAHPGPGSTNPSIAGVVATSDSNFVKYYTEVRVQESRTEVRKCWSTARVTQSRMIALQIIVDLKNMVVTGPRSSLSHLTYCTSVLGPGTLNVVDQPWFSGWKLTAWRTGPFEKVFWEDETEAQSNHFLS